jgi:hypothetical protein
MVYFSYSSPGVNVSPAWREAMSVPSTFRKTEVVAVQHVTEESEKPLTPDGVEIRHLRQKIVIPGKPYRELLTVQISEVFYCIRIVQFRNGVLKLSVALGLSGKPFRS